MFVGIDVHKVSCSVTVLNQPGAIIDTFKIKNTLTGWKKFFARIPETSKIVFEASSGSGPIFDLLTDHGFEVTLANPREVRLIGESKKKSDSFDSKTLAQLLRAGFLPASHIPNREVRAERELHRHRINLGKKRTAVQIQIKSLITRTTIPCDIINLFNLLTIKGLDVLGELSLFPCEQIVLESLLGELKILTQQITGIDAELKRYAKNHRSLMKLLLTVPGISYYSAMVLINEIGDIARFRSGKHLASFIGIVPSNYQSGERQISGRITRRGNVYLRWILNQSVIHAVRYASPLRDFYRRIKDKKGVGCARVAAERKLVTILYHMMKNNEEYRFQKEELTERKWKMVFGKDIPN